MLFLVNLALLCLIESQIHLGWLRQEVTSGELLVRTDLLEQVAQVCVLAGLDHFQWWTFHRLSEQPLPVFAHLCRKKKKKKPFLYVRRNFLYFTLFLLPLVRFLGTLTGVWLSFLYSPRYLCTWVRSPWAFSAAGGTTSDLSISLCMKDVPVSKSFLWPLIAFTSVFSCFSWTVGANNWTQHSQVVGQLTSTEHRARITLFNLLAMLCLMQPRRLLTFFAPRTHFWLMVKLEYTKTHQSFSVKLLSSQLPPNLYWEKGLSTPMFSTFTCLYWLLWGSCWPISQNCWSPFEGQHNPSGTSLSFLALCCSFLTSRCVVNYFYMTIIMQTQGSELFNCS